MILIIDTFDFLPFKITSANLSPASRREVYDRVLYDVRRTHNTFRAADSLSDKGILCYYVDRACGYLAYFFNSFRRYSASLVLSDGERSKSKSS